MYRHKLWLPSIPLLVALLLAACGGSPQYAQIGGTVTGLQPSGVLILQNKKSDDLVLIKNQPFLFATPANFGERYDVSVRQQPLGRTCVVRNGAGIVGPSTHLPTNMGVDCTQTASVYGLLMGLKQDDGGLTLSLNGVPMVLTSSGFFEFPGLLAPGSEYKVTIVQQPAGVTCRVLNASGVVVANTLVYVEVGCPRPYPGPVPIDSVPSPGTTAPDGASSADLPPVSMHHFGLATAAT